MKRMLIAGALALAAAGQAFAADLPPAPGTYMPTEAPIYNWGGFYVGVNGGYGFGASNWSDPNNAGRLNDTVAGPPAKSTGDFSTSGFLVGGTVGANFQLSRFVLGIEGDVDASTIMGKINPKNGFCGNYLTSGFTAPYDPASSCQTADNVLATVRGRLGYALDRVLIFGTGGAAFGKVGASLTGGGFGTPTYQNTTAVGWTAGGGLEFALFDNLTAKIEYLYVDLGSQTACNTYASCGYDYNTTIGAFAPNDAIKFTANIVRIGINYKFGGFR